MTRSILLAFLALIMAGCGNARDADVPATTTDSTRAPDTTASPPAAANKCASLPARDDRTICGRERLGPITPATTRAQLDSLFGGGALVDETVPLGEGETGVGTVVNRGRADSATVVWTDSTRLRILQVLRLGPAWRTEQGLGTGSSLHDIVNALGPQVTVLGYGWDYGGTVMLTGTKLDNSGVAFRTSPRGTTPAAREAAARVQGDSPFPATSADVRALDPVVYSVDLIWR